MTDRERFEKWMIAEADESAEPEDMWQAWQAARRWISVEEYFPPTDTEILCLYDDCRIIVNSWHDTNGYIGWSELEDDTPLYWQRLPERPKEMIL